MWSLYLSIAAIVLSLFGLLHTVIFNLRYAKREIISRQIMLVLDLLEKINKTKINVYCANINNRSSHGKSMDLNLWEISDLKNNDFDKDFEDDVVLFQTGSNSLFDLEKYLNNPILPTTIREELMKFFSKRTHNLTKENINDEYYVILETGHFNESPFNLKKDQISFYNQSNATAYVSWLSFKNASGGLKKEIRRYFNSSNIGLANIRSDFEIQ